MATVAAAGNAPDLGGGGEGGGADVLAAEAAREVAAGTTGSRPLSRTSKADLSVDARCAALAGETAAAMASKVASPA